MPQAGTSAHVFFIVGNHLGVAGNNDDVTIDGINHRNGDLHDTVLRHPKDVKSFLVRHVFGIQIKGDIVHVPAFRQPRLHLHNHARIVLHSGNFFHACIDKRILLPKGLVQSPEGLSIHRSQNAQLALNLGVSNNLLPANGKHITFCFGFLLGLE